jgi:hypothetical protein
MRSRPTITRRLTFLTFFLTAVVAGVIWNNHRGKHATLRATHQLTPADTARPAIDPALQNRRPNLLRRLSDPLSLQDFSNRGLLDKDVAARISGLLAEGRYEEALQLSQSLPKDTVGNMMCSVSVWKEWAGHDREAALAAWEKHPEAHQKTETQGLIWGLEEMEEADRFDWIKAHAKSVNDPIFSSLIVTDLASQWLLAGEIGAAQFTDLAGLLPEDQRLRAMSEGLSAATTRCQELFRKGRLDKHEALSVLHDFLGVQEQMLHLNTVGSADVTGIHLGTLAVEMEGLLPMVDFYGPPGSGLLRDQYLEDIGRALKPHGLAEIASLAATDSSGGASIWKGYLTTLDLRQDFIAVADQVSQSHLPDSVLDVIAAEALHQSNDALAPYATLFEELNRLPPSHFKDLTFAAMAVELDKSGRPVDGAACRAKIQDRALAKPAQ